MLNLSLAIFGHSTIETGGSNTRPHWDGKTTSIKPRSHVYLAFVFVCKSLQMTADVDKKLGYRIQGLPVVLRWKVNRAGMLAWQPSA
jgi:hypothetical protein